MSETPNIPEEKLFTNFTPEHPYPSKLDDYQAHLLEQYKLYVGMADKISERRQSANSYFLSLNTALLGFVGYITLNNCNEFMWLMGVAGCTLSYFWYRLIRSYRDLNTAKFLVVHKIEKKLPLNPYDAEWEAMGRGENSKLYKPITHIEIGVPWVFFALHLFIVVRTVQWLQLCKHITISH
jgi:hypothetical protein